MDVVSYAYANEIPDDAQMLLQSQSITQGKRYWHILESSQMDEFKNMRYLLVRDDNGLPIAFAAHYTIIEDIAIFAPPALRNMLWRIRRRFPNFLKLRMLECGSPINVNAPVVVSEHANQNQAIALISQALFQAAKRERALLLVVRDFSPPGDSLQQAFESLGFAIVPGLPNTWLDIHWQSPQAYLAAMKSYYRSKLKKHLKKNQQAGIRAELIEDFAPLAERLSEQWMTVHRQAKEYQREVLTPDFYRHFSNELGNQSRLLAFYRHDEMIGHALLLIDHDTLRWLYFGRNAARNDSLYILVAYKVIEVAIELGLRRIEQGLTTYSLKRDVGGQLIDVHYALSARWPLLNPVIRWGYRLLNKTPNIENKNIFKQASH